MTEKACEGYIIDQAQRIIQLDPNEDAQFVFTNTIKPSLQIIKTSADGSRLKMYISVSPRSRTERIILTAPPMNRERFFDCRFGARRVLRAGNRHGFSLTFSTCESITWSCSQAEPAP